MVVEEQFVAAIDLIADKLGIAVTEVFEIFVSAQAIIGVMMILECLTVIVMCSNLFHNNKTIKWSLYF